MAFGRRLAVAIVTVPALVLGGCADDPRPEPAPPSETATTGSPSPSATPTKRPWEKRTDAGAVAFAKHWIAVFSQAMNESDSRPLRDLSHASCKTCVAVADRMDGIQNAGGYYRSPGWTVLQVVLSPKSKATEAIVTMRVLQGKEVFKESDDAREVRNPASRATYEAQLGWIDDEWRMMELRLLA